MLTAIFSMSTFAGKPADGFKGNGSPKAKFEKFLLVAPGNPNNQQDELTNFLKNDNSNGRAIFIPVKTKNGPNSIYCENADNNGGSWIVGDSEKTNLVDVFPDQGVKLYFTKDSTLTSLDIVDRDATDGYAEVAVPEDWSDANYIDLWIRVLGKPGGCFQTDAYTYDGNDYFWAGSAAFKRKAGQSTFVDAGELTDVWYCPDYADVVDLGGGNYDCICNDASQCTVGTSVAGAELNVFADVFQDYFWDMTNDGVRVIQVLIRAQ